MTPATHMMLTVQIERALCLKTRQTLKVLAAVLDRTIASLVVEAVEDLTTKYGATIRAYDKKLPESEVQS